MKVIYLTEEDLINIPIYELPKKIIHDESHLYKYNAGKLLKIFKSSEEKFIIHKMYVLNKVFYLKRYIDFKEIIFPDELVKVKNLSSGYTMKFIKNNINGELLLSNNSIPISEQILFLKSIGNILEKLESDNILKEKDFHLGDIHEGNFIFNKDTNNINIVDIDSCYIKGLDAPKSKFLTYNDKLWNFEKKYPYEENTGNHIPNYNTTIISYIYILLNYISQEYSPNYSKNKFLNMLNIMLSIGFNKELCDSIVNIYKEDNNYLDFELINTITPRLILKYRSISQSK